MYQLIQFLGFILVFTGFITFGYGVQMEQTNKKSSVRLNENYSINDPSFENGVYNAEITTDYVFLVKDGQTKRIYKYQKS